MMGDLGLSNAGHCIDEAPCSDTSLNYLFVNLQGVLLSLKRFSSHSSGKAYQTGKNLDFPNMSDGFMMPKDLLTGGW